MTEKKKISAGGPSSPVKIGIPPALSGCFPGGFFQDVTDSCSAMKLILEKIDTDARFYRETIALMASCCPPGTEIIAGIESRGFILGAALAERLGSGFVPIRKKGRSPYGTVSVEYEMESGHEAIEVHPGAFRGGKGVVLVDDVLACGATAAAACRLAERAGGDVLRVIFLAEMAVREGRKLLGGRDARALFTV